MNDKQLENTVRQDVAKLNRDLTKSMDEDFSQLGEGLGKLTSDVGDTVVSAGAVVKKDVGLGLIRYNAKAQEVADKLPGGLGEKAAKYTWVTVSIALAVGFLLGNLLKPTRQPLG